MANIAFNIAFISGYEIAKSKEIIDYFNENFDVIDEPDDDDANEGSFEIHFDSRWSTPKDDLLKLVRKFVMDVAGVSYERGTMYVSCWNFRSTKIDGGSINTEVKLFEA